jgi:small-conductance mechanosensitive channel
MTAVFIGALFVWLLFKVSKAVAGLALLGLIVFFPAKTVLVLLILIGLSSLM